MKKNIEKDVKALANAWFKNVYHHDDCEFGTIGSDCKRPFGNSSVEEDVLKIIGAEMEGNDGYDKCYSSSQRDYAFMLAREYMPKFIREKVKVDTSDNSDYLQAIRDIKTSDSRKRCVK